MSIDMHLFGHDCAAKTELAACREELRRVEERLLAVEEDASTLAAEARRLRVELRKVEKQRDRACYIAEHLHQMVPRGVWREHGAEWQGQYEGDYHAEQAAEEIKALTAGTWEPQAGALSQTNAVDAGGNIHKTMKGNDD